MSPTGDALAAACDRLIGTAFLKFSDRVVLFNAGSGDKYTDVLGEVAINHALMVRDSDASC